MMRILLGWLLVLAVLVSALPWELAAAAPGDGDSTAVEAPVSPYCPDSEPLGDSCGGGCLCPCCPAHTLPPPVSDLALAAPVPNARGLLPSYSGGLYPRDVRDRVFHPPRLG